MSGAAINKFFPINTPWAVLLCKFNDDDSEPFQKSFYDDLFTASGVGSMNMVDFFRDVSNGMLDLGGTQVFGWFTFNKEPFNKKRSDYKGSGGNQAGRDELVSWARQAAAAKGHDLSNFFGVVVCMNVPTEYFGGGRRAVFDSTSMRPSVIGQEMGHGYGLDHSRIDGSTADYQDRWDVMSTECGYLGNQCAFMASHPRYTSIGPSLNAANMDSRGWLDKSRVWDPDVFEFNAIVKLRPLVRYDLPGYLAARAGKYLVEFRVKEGWDAAIPEPAILVHRFEDNHSYIMPDTSGRQDLIKRSIFEAGDPRITPQSWTKVEVIDINANDHVATIRLSGSGARVPHVPIALGPEILLGGITKDGGGVLIFGGQVFHIPPRSPVLRIVEQVASIQASDFIADATSRDAVRLEALKTIASQVESQMASMRAYRQPAPHVRGSKHAPKGRRSK